MSSGGFAGTHQTLANETTHRDEEKRNPLLFGVRTQEPFDYCETGF